MFDRKSDYALNKKDISAIVYIDADKHIVRLTRENFASEEEFLRWKKWSDADYHETEKRDHVHANHIRRTFSEVKCSAPTAAGISTGCAAPGKREMSAMCFIVSATAGLKKRSVPAYSSMRSRCLQALRIRFRKNSTPPWANIHSQWLRPRI